MATKEMETTELPAEEGNEGKTRADFLRAAGIVAGAAVVGQLASGEPAGAANNDLLTSGITRQPAAADGTAADGGPVILGQDSTATLRTSVTSAVADSEVFAAFSGGANTAALYGRSTGSGGQGVNGEATGTDGIGVFGVATAADGTGVFGIGPSNGGVFQSTHAAIWLRPQATAGSPTGGSAIGEMAVDSTGQLWLCVGNGNPGTWIKASHGGTRLLPVPVRAYSSTDPGAGGALLGAAAGRPVTLAGVNGVPANALGVILNITVHQTVGAGFVTAFPTGASQPATSSINWSSPNLQVANGATLAVGTSGRVSFYANGTMPVGAAATQLIVDVTGYIL